MNRLKLSVTSKDHILGAEDAALTLVEYGDYQCPACAIAHPRIKRLLAVFPEDLRLVFRNFPLTQIHEFALLGSLAAEAAALQGQFWEMHDLIFENQDFLDPQRIMELAQWLSLDVDQFQRDLDNEELHARVQEDFMSGVRSGVSGTPGLFLNDIKYTGPLDVEVFARLLKTNPDREEHIYF